MGFYSRYLLEQLEDFLSFCEDEDRNDPTITPQNRENTKELERLCDIAIEGKSTWHGVNRLRERTTLEKFERILASFPEHVDQVLTKKLLEDMDGVVTRLIEVPAILLTSHPPVAVRSMMLEATRCYVHGLFQGAAVLTRSTMQAALEDRLRGQRTNGWRRTLDRGAPHGTQDTLRQLLERARGARVIRHEMFERLDVVRLTGSRAAHGRTVSQEDARAALLTIRDLVERLYSAVVR